METCVKLDDLNKWFGSFQVLDSINLSISKGEKVVICGPSGSGKSTLIRCVNALESFQSGAVNVCGISVDLPEPEGPQITTFSPVEIVKLIESRTWKSPNHLLRSVRLTQVSIVIP